MLMNRGFVKAARNLGLTNTALESAVQEIEDGLVDARLAGFC
jgi:hypothetical protein